MSETGRKYLVAKIKKPLKIKRLTTIIVLLHEKIEVVEDEKEVEETWCLGSFKNN